MNPHRHRLFSLLALVCTHLLSPEVAARDGLRLWQEGDVRLPESRHGRFNLGWKLVYDERTGKTDSWELKPQGRRALAPWLDGAATYKLSRSLRGDNAGAFTHALELDLIPKLRVGDNISVQCTQRLGLVRSPGRETTLNHRYHVIPKVEWPAAWLPRQTSAETSLEVIYDFSPSGWVETKFTPLRLKFAGGPLRSWSVFYMLNDKRGDPRAPWSRDHVLALTLHY